MTQTPPDDAIEATFAFVDLAGFTAMTEAHGDTEAVTIVRGFRDRALRVLGPGSELVKSIGDAVMLRFPTPLAAVVALRELLQRELVVKDAVLLPRAGPHPGPAMVVDGDYYGAAVNLAARVAGRRPRSCGRTARCSNPAFSAKSDSGMSQDVSAINCEQHHRILATPAEPTRPGRER